MLRADFQLIAPELAVGWTEPQQLFQWERFLTTGRMAGERNCKRNIVVPPSLALAFCWGGRGFGLVGLILIVLLIFLLFGGPRMGWHTYQALWTELSKIRTQANATTVS